MTHENSEGAAHLGVADPAQEPIQERASMSDETTDPMIQIDVEPPVFAVPQVGAAAEDAPASDVGDSMPPLSRKLAPPPKPRRDSGGASRPPSAHPPTVDALSDPLTSSALRAPIAPSVSYAGVQALSDAPGEPPLTDGAPAPGSVPPLSSPPPLPLRRSSPAMGEDAELAGSASARMPSDPALGILQPKPATAPPRPTSVHPEPSASSEPGLLVESAATASMAGTDPVAPQATSAIFAMRIIAVGDPTRPAPVPIEVPADGDSNAYPPVAARLGSGMRRSSRPKMAAVLTPDVPTDTPSAVAEVPPARLAAEAEATAAQVASGSRSSPLAVAAPHDEGAEELSDDDVSPDSITKKAVLEAEDLPREEAISMPPDEVAALFQAEAKSDPGKPPPPPKRAAGAPPAASASEAPPAASAARSATPPPTPDLAAAKAAQRKNTRAPWWEDLFNEDFTRASSRVSDEQIRREVTFIEESLGVAAGGVVLDLGCGAGHHAVEFASRGYGVVGYDLSLYQLALAADVAQERSQKINFLQGDMREMAFEEMFDGVFCWNTTFGYFEEDKNLAVAQRVFKSLRPGGMFLIDVLNRDFAAASAPYTVWYEGDSCVCMDDMSVDYISSRLRVKRSIILDDGRTKESLFSLRLYSLHELGKLLHEVGFRVTEASGHPATPGVFFGPNSPRIIILAQRP